MLCLFYCQSQTEQASQNTDNIVAGDSREYVIQAIAKLSVLVTEPVKIDKNGLRNYQIYYKKGGMS